MLYDVTSRLTLGAAYQSLTSQGKFANYSDLFAQGGGFNIPATSTAGLAWKITSPSVVAFDVENISYGQIASVANPFSNLITGPRNGQSFVFARRSERPGIRLARHDVL